MERYIVVIAETRRQFEDYASKTAKSELLLMRHFNKLKVKEFTFLWATSHYSIMGYAFSKDSKLVKVGSWYNLPANEIAEIETAFKCRKVK